MRRFLRRIVCCVSVICLFASCGSKNNSQIHDTLDGKRMDVRYAKGFDIIDYDVYKKVVVYSPWIDGEVQQCFYLVKNDTVTTPPDGQKIIVPVETVAISSCTHTEFLELIGMIDRVKAMCSPNLIYNSRLQERYASGDVKSIGDAYATDIERLLVINPDVYFVSSYNQQDENSKRLLQSGVRVVYNNEWTETSLLARAEWIKYVAVFADRSEMADSVFAGIEHTYLEAKKLASSMQLTHKPKVMVGSNFKGTWYVPGGKSYMGQLLVDAGADYFYADEETTTSIPLNFEMVLQNFQDSEVWLSAPTTTIDELLRMDERHALFSPTRTGEVYSFYARTKPGGANDFWESAVAHPDIVLYDVIWAFHHDALPYYQPIYIMKLN